MNKTVVFTGRPKSGSWVLLIIACMGLVLVGSFLYQCWHQLHTASAQSPLISGTSRSADIYFSKRNCL